MSEKAVINNVLLKPFEGDEMVYSSTNMVINTDKTIYCPIDGFNTISLPTLL